MDDLINNKTKKIPPFISLVILYHNFVNISSVVVRICLQTRNDARAELCAEMHLQNFVTSRPNHAEGVYIINSVGIAYHQCEALYIIKPQEDARYRVMIYNKGRHQSAFVDEMHAARDDMPSLRLG